MNEEDIKKGVKEAFFRTFPNLKDEEFGFDKTAEDFEEWDSLSHMTLISELEKEFSTSMEIDEISEMDSVRNVVEVLKKKLG